MHWLQGDRAGAERTGREAVEVLEGAGDGGLLALALSNQSQLLMLRHETAAAIEYGQRAVALARQAQDPATTSHALTNIGTAQWFIPDPAAQATLDEALRIALDARDAENACRAYVNTVWNLLDWFRLDEAERYLTAALKFTEDAEFLGFLSYLQAAQARLEFSRGRWDAACALAGPGRDAHAQARCPSLTLLGWARVRRGEPGADGLLSEAWDLAVQLDELQRMAPVAAARAEAAWLRGDHAAVRAAPPPRTSWPRASATSRAGPSSATGWAGPEPRCRPPASTPTPCRRRGGGRTRPPHGPPPGAPTSRPRRWPRDRAPGRCWPGWRSSTSWGRPLAALVRSELRSRGLTRIPRGPTEGTRGNPAGLTARQVDVLRLLGQGRTNAQIASALVVSVRTVDSHVAAVLGKLGAADRRAAAARAAELGLLDAGDQ